MTTDDSMSALFAGQSGLQPPGGRTPFDSYIGPLPEEPAALPAELEAYDCRQGRMAMHAAEAVADSIEEVVARRGPERVAVLVGTSTGGLLGTEEAFPSFRDGAGPRGCVDVTRQHAFSAAAELLSERFGVRGPTFSISTACSSSSKIIGSAHRLIEAGFVDAAVLVGADTLCQLTSRGFGGLNLLADSQCRPFDAARDGINIGEASAAMVVEAGNEDARYGVWGIGELNGGYHMTRPHPEGRGAARSMLEAIEAAGLEPADIAAVSAHGTATVNNDTVESKAIVDVVGPNVPVFSTKGQTGHTLGACGALEAVIALEALERGQLPGTYGLREVDPDVQARINRDVCDFDGDFILSNSLAFGDNNVSLVLGRL